jgi:tRNA G18 (ribose-2'-O)-methylase SpoU
MLIPIDDPGDPRVAPFMNVRDRDLNDGHGGRYIAEGESVLAVALAERRHPIEALLVADNRLATLADWPVDPDLPVYVASQTVMDAIVGFPIHRGLLGVGRRGELPDAARLLDAEPRLVLGLVGIANHDNMGGICRNAAAFGAGAVLLDDTSCDPFYRKALRVSVGGVLKLALGRAGSGLAMVEALAAAGYRPLGLSPRGALSLDEVDRTEKLALILGTEGPGLSAALLGRVTGVRIDMPGGFDSLNVATTSGIALYELSKARPPALARPPASG